MNSNDLAGTGMTKLIYSGSLPDNFDMQLEIIEDPAKFVKRAAANGGLFDYEALKPDADHVGIHVLALGDFERYGSNRNGDGFSKAANRAYHDTFVKLGAVFRHHQNKDRNKSLGKIAASAYNEDMGRIELFLHANKKACAEELERLEKNGEIPCSMACRVSFDRCLICNNLRKSAKDPNQCDHVKYELGKVAEDGRVTCTMNDEPRFFDLSFVWRPADRIAWSLKTASDGQMDSVKLAEEAGLYLPEQVALDSDAKLRKLAVAKDLARYERKYLEMAATAPVAGADCRLWELRKSAATSVDDATIEKLREHEPGDVFYVMANHQVVLDPASFLKYALGKAAAGVPVAAVRDRVRGIFDELEKKGELCSIAADSAYDARIPEAYSAVPRTFPELERLVTGVAPLASFAVKMANHRTVEATIAGDSPSVRRGEENSGGELAKYLATRYATYKLAAVCAMQALHKDMDECTVALAAAQNLTSKQGE